MSIRAADCGSSVRERKGGVYRSQYTTPAESRKAKRCARCGQTKPASEFGPNPKLKDGLHSYCRRCAADYHNQWRRRDPRNRQKDTLYKRRHRRLHPERARARRGVTRLLRDGVLQPEPCAICGATEKIERHHPNYERLPLFTIPLCIRCHKAHDAALRMRADTPAEHRRLEHLLARLRSDRQAKEVAA